MLYQLSYFRILQSLKFRDDFAGLRLNLWEKMDSNHRRYKPADLQSAPFGHSGILPYFSFLFRNHFVSHRIVGQSFTRVNSFPPHSTFSSFRKTNFKIFISFPKSLRQSSYRRLTSSSFQKNFEPMEGIEPTTPRLQITCSSQLSYIGETS